MFSVDVGYGFTKGVTHEARVSFPSVTAPRRVDRDLAMALGRGGPRHKLDVEPLGGKAQSWWIGQAALDADGLRAWDTAASTRAGYDLLVLGALYLLGAEGEVDVVAGLPLAVWASKGERKALKNRLTDLSAWVAVDEGAARYIRIRSVKVFPQGVGAYLAVLQSPYGRRFLGQPVGLVDIGYRTTDYVLLFPQDGLAVPDEARSGSVDTGVGRAYDAVRDKLAAETGTLVPESIVENALRNGGFLSVRGTERDLRDEFRSACEELAAEIEAHVRRSWGDRLDFLSAVILAGGGAEAVRQHLRLPALVVAPDPVYANAAGFLQMSETAANV